MENLSSSPFCNNIHVNCRFNCATCTFNVITFLALAAIVVGGLALYSSGKDTGVLSYLGQMGKTGSVIILSVGSAILFARVMYFLVYRACKEHESNSIDAPKLSPNNKNKAKTIPVNILRKSPNKAEEEEVKQILDNRQEDFHCTFKELMRWKSLNKNKKDLRCCYQTLPLSNNKRQLCIIYKVNEGKRAMELVVLEEENDADAQFWTKVTNDLDTSGYTLYGVGGLIIGGVNWERIIQKFGSSEQEDQTLENHEELLDQLKGHRQEMSKLFKTMEAQKEGTFYQTYQKESLFYVLTTKNTYRKSDNGKKPIKQSAHTLFIYEKSEEQADKIGRLQAAKCVQVKSS